MWHGPPITVPVRQLPFIQRRIRSSVNAFVIILACLIMIDGIRKWLRVISENDRNGAKKDKSAGKPVQRRKSDITSKSKTGQRRENGFRNSILL